MDRRAAVSRAAASSLLEALADDAGQGGDDCLALRRAFFVGLDLHRRAPVAFLLALGAEVVDSHSRAVPVIGELVAPAAQAELAVDLRGEDVFQIREVVVVGVEAARETVSLTCRRDVNDERIRVVFDAEGNLVLVLFPALCHMLRGEARLVEDVLDLVGVKREAHAFG